MKPNRITVPLLALALLLALAWAPSAWAEFTVTFPSGLTASFASAEGMEAQAAPLKLRGDPIKMPGIAKYSQITLYDGVFNNSDQVWQLIDQVRMNTIARSTIVVSSGGTNWVLKNAWPVKIGGAAPDGDTVRVEVMQIAHEELVVQHQ